MADISFRRIALANGLLPVTSPPLPPTAEMPDFTGERREEPVEPPPEDRAAARRSLH